MLPVTPCPMQKQDYCTCVVLSIVPLFVWVWLNGIKESQASSVYLHLLSIARHERPTRDTLFIWSVRSGDFFDGRRSPFINISHYLCKNNLLVRIGCCSSPHVPPRRTSVGEEGCWLVSAHIRQPRLRWRFVADSISVRLASNSILRQNQPHQSRRDC